MKYKHSPTNIFNPEIPFGGIIELFYGVGWDICEPTIWLIWCNIVQYSIPIPKWFITFSVFLLSTNILANTSYLEANEPLNAHVHLLRFSV